MPIQDANLIVRATSDGAMTVTTVSSSLDIWGSPIKGNCVEVVVTALAGTMDTTDTLDVIVRGSTATDPATTSPVVGERTAIAGADSLSSYIIPFTLQPGMRSIDVEFAINGGASDSPSWTLDAWVTLNVGVDWKRSVNFTDTV